MLSSAFHKRSFSVPFAIVFSLCGTALADIDTCTASLSCAQSSMPYDFTVSGCAGLIPLICGVFAIWPNLGYLPEEERTGLQVRMGRHLPQSVCEPLIKLISNRLHQVDPIDPMLQVDVMVARLAFIGIRH